MPACPSFLSKWIHGKTMAVAATSLGGELMAVVFNFYYIKVFLHLYKLDNKWLNISQVLFLVWNAINDPLFGYMQDFGCGSCCRWVTKRRKVILYCGPIYAMVFMIPWIPWAHGNPSWLVGLHLLTSLFFYDALLSLVLSAQCGLFTELSTEHRARVRVVVYMEIASLLASFAIFPVDKLSDSLQNFTNFQICCAVLALAAASCFLYTGMKGPRSVAQVEEKTIQQMELSAVKFEHPEGTVECSEENGKNKNFLHSMREGFRSSKDILTNRDFGSVVLANFFHILRSTGDANFLTIFTESLISPNYGVLAKGSVALSLFYTGCNVVPKIFLALCWPLLQKFGAWSLTMMTAVLTVINCLAIFFIGRHSYSALAIFFLIELHPLSTSIFTLNALFTKPAISLAPIIIVAFLSSSNYRAYSEWTEKLERHSTNSTYIDSLPTPMPEAKLDSLFDNMFLVACFFPLACSLLEAVCLVPYTLKFRHKRDSEMKK